MTTAFLNMDQRGVGESRPQLVYESSAWKPRLLYTDEATATAHMLKTAQAAQQVGRGVRVVLEPHLALSQPSRDSLPAEDDPVLEPPVQILL